MNTLVSEIKPSASKVLRVVQQFIFKLSLIVSCLQPVNQRNVSPAALRVSVPAGYWSLLQTKSPSLREAGSLENRVN